jgi:UPF0755 protein
MFNISHKRIILIFLAIFSLAVVIVALRIGLFLINPAEKGGADQVIVVEEGLSLLEVADELERKKIITNRSLFMMWARVKGYSTKIKAGEYQLNPRMAPIRVLEILTTGTIITHAVTIPEGFTNEQIAELLSRKGLVNKQRFLSLTDDPEVLKKHGISGPSLEGYLYPDTYQFGRGLSAESIIDVMVRRFWDVAKPFAKRAEESGMKMKEVVIIASIVEKETGLGEERPIIASVFLNRIKKRMRLASDPTVIYGIKNFDGNLTRKDLATRTPYNTYVIRGLPPGPIANPGQEAIKAVLYPAKTNYLYFVSKNDGSHHFSKTLKEHNKAVIKYQKRRRTRHRKTS